MYSDDSSDESEEEIQNVEELEPRIRRFFEKEFQRIRAEIRSEIRNEYEEKYKMFKHLVSDENETEEVLAVSESPSTSLVELEEVIFIEEVRPWMEIINPIDGIHQIPETLKLNPHLKASKTLFKRFAIEKKNSNSPVCRKAICLLLNKPENAYDQITREDYKAVCKLPFRKVKPTGKAKAVCFFAVPPKSTNEERCLRVYRRVKKSISPGERVCSECFRYGTGTSSVETYNKRLVCSSCGDQDMFMGRIYCQKTAEEEVIVPFTRSFRITLPYLKREEKAKLILCDKAGLKKAKETLAEDDKKDLQLIKSQSICSPDEGMVVNHVSCLKVAYLIRSLFKDPNGPKIKLNSSCIQMPKLNLQGLIEELSAHKMTITAKLTNEPPPALPDFMRLYRNGDLFGVIYEKWNEDIDYDGLRRSLSGRKNSTDASTADQMYEKATGKRLNEKKSFTSEEVRLRPRAESIVTMAYALAYFLKLTNPLAGRPVQHSNKEVDAGVLNYEEDGINILNMVHRLFRATVEVTFDA